MYHREMVWILGVDYVGGLESATIRQDVWGVADCEMHESAGLQMYIIDGVRLDHMNIANRFDHVILV